MALVHEDSKCTIDEFWNDAGSYAMNDSGDLIECHPSYQGGWYFDVYIKTDHDYVLGDGGLYVVWEDKNGNPDYEDLLDDDEAVFHSYYKSSEDVVLSEGYDTKITEEEFHKAIGW